MAKKPTDLDFVLAAAAAASAVKPRKSWYAKLPPDAQSRLAEIKKAYDAGRFEHMNCTVIREAINALLKENGWPVPQSAETIIRWLRSSGT